MSLAAPGDLLSHAWVWLLVLLGPLLFFQRRLQLELQAVLYLITGRQDVALVIFSIVLLPGVFLHEASHWLVAKLVGARTGRFSLTPQVMAGGVIRMGYVEFTRVDSLRETAIGAAPLIFGGALLAYAGIGHLQAVMFSQALQSGQVEAFFERLGQLPSQPDFWLWIYLVFAVSTTMFPSPSDRRAWLPVGLVALAIAGAALLAGAGPWLAVNLGPILERVAGAIAIVGGVCLGVQAMLLLPLWLIRLLICRWKGVRLA